jgi:hypothetical protein
MAGGITLRMRVGQAHSWCPQKVTQIGLSKHTRSLSVPRHRKITFFEFPKFVMMVRVSPIRWRTVKLALRMIPCQITTYSPFSLLFSRSTCSLRFSRTAAKYHNELASFILKITRVAGALEYIGQGDCRALGVGARVRGDQLSRLPSCHKNRTDRRFGQALHFALGKTRSNE